MVRIPGIGGPESVPLYVARHETTWREYLVSVREAGCSMPRKDGQSRYDPSDTRLADNHPVTYLPIQDYACYLNWLAKRTGKAYRLPTAIEWEHIARAGTNTPYTWGVDLGSHRAIIGTRYDRAKLRPNDSKDPRHAVSTGLLRPVESLAPNPWGLFDTIGNAGEATSETKDGTATCLRTQSADWCRLVAIRGGDGFPTDSTTLMTDRSFTFAGAANSTVGFRPVHN